MSSRLVAVCAALILLSGCSSSSLESLEPVRTSAPTPAEESTPSADPTPSATPSEEAEPEEEPAAGTTIEALGIDWPAVSPDEVPWPELPGAPAGFTARDVQALARPLQGWAARAALDPAVWSGSAEAGDIMAPIGDTAYLAVDASRKSISPTVAVGSTFGKGVEVQGAPRMTSAWKVQTVSTGRGTALRLTLQTRTAYQLQRGDRQRVVGVVREHALGTLPGGTPQGALSVIGWYEYGASECAIVLDDVLVPDREVDAKDLARFVKIGSSKAFATPQVDEDLDQAFKQRCAAKA